MYKNAVVELFYTSATTGPPKGVAITNRSLYLHTLGAIIGFQVTDVEAMLHIVPLFHVNGWGTPQFLTALGGKHVMLQKNGLWESTAIDRIEEDNQIIRRSGYI